VGFALKLSPGSMKAVRTSVYNLLLRTPAPKPWRRGLGTGLAPTGLSFVLSGPASSLFFRFDVLVTIHFYGPL
jgi:hypothetical protein